MFNSRKSALECELRRGCTFSETFISEVRSDERGGTSHGSIFNRPVFARGLTVDGTNYIDYGIIPQALPSSIVVQFTAPAACEAVLVGNTGYQITGDGFCIWIDSEGVKANYSDGVSTETELSVPVGYADGEVHTVTYVIGATNHTLYVDSLTEDTAAVSTTGPIGTATDLNIGGDSTYLLTGTVLLVKIFDAELTSTEHGLYRDGKVTSFVLDAYAAYSCDGFGDDTVGHLIWSTKYNDKDLTKGDGTTSATFPTLVTNANHNTEYYSFDGANDYVSDWPRPTGTYTVSAAISTAYPTGTPNVNQCNDTTVEDLLTVGGAFSGNLHSLYIFEGELSPLQLYHLEYTQLQRCWRETRINPYLAELIRAGVCVMAYEFSHPETLLNDYVRVHTPTASGVAWDEGLTIPTDADYVDVANHSSLQLDALTIFVAGDFSTGTVVEKGANYLFQVGYNPSTTEVFPSFNLVDLDTAYYDLKPRSVAVTMTESGDTPEFFVNGKSAGPGDSTATLTSSDTSVVTIGNLNLHATRMQNKLNALYIFNKPLAEREIEMLHHYASGNMYDASDILRAQIYDVDGDDSIIGGQTDVIMQTKNAGASEGDIILTNNEIYDASTITVEQSIDSWSQKQIQFDVAQGGLTAPGTVYAWVKRSDGVISAEPYPVTLLANILVDGNMEAADTSAWTVVSGGILAKEAGARTGGTGSLVMSIDKTTGDNSGAMSQSVLTNGVDYNITGWARGSDTAGIPTIGDVTFTNIFTGTTSSTWQYFDVDFTASGTLIYFVNLIVTTTGDKVYFDDVVITEV